MSGESQRAATTAKIISLMASRMTDRQLTTELRRAQENLAMAKTTTEHMNCKIAIFHSEIKKRKKAKGKDD